jgi:hypothetical protein
MTPRPHSEMRGLNKTVTFEKGNIIYVYIKCRFDSTVILQKKVTAGSSDNPRSKTQYILIGPLVLHCEIFCLGTVHK